MPFDEKLSNSLQLKDSPFDNYKLGKKIRKVFNKRFFRDESDIETSRGMFFNKNIIKRKFRREHYPGFFKTLISN